MKRRLLGLSVVFVLIGIILISESGRKGSGSIIEETVGDVWGKESVEDYVITGYFEKGVIISVSLWAGGDWLEDPFEVGDDFHPYEHVDVFLCIFDEEGKNITLVIPFVPQVSTCWPEPEGIFSMFSNAVHWYNQTNFGLITSNGSYTVKFLGSFPPRRSPIYRLLVTRKMLQSSGESGQFWNNPLSLSGVSSFVVGICIFLTGLIKGKKATSRRSRLMKNKQGLITKDIRFCELEG